MGTPYENPPKLSDPVTAPAAVTVALDFPSRSIISGIKVIQASGVAALFDVEIYNRDPAKLPVGVPLAIYNVCSKKTATVAGQLLYFSDEATGGHGFTFYSQDDPDPKRIQANTRKLYVRITSQGTGVKTFLVVLTGEIQVGGE